MNPLFVIFNVDSQTEVVYGSTPARAWQAYFALGFTKGTFECKVVD